MRRASKQVRSKQVISKSVAASLNCLAKLVTTDTDVVVVRNRVMVVRKRVMVSSLVSHSCNQHPILATNKVMAHESWHTSHVM